MLRTTETSSWGRCRGKRVKAETAGDQRLRPSVPVDLAQALSNPGSAFRRALGPVVSGEAPPTPETPRQRQTHLTDEQRIELIERYMSGERAFELAKDYKIDRRTVAAILTRAGLRRPRSMTEEERAEASRLYEAGWSCARIGNQLGRDHGTVWLALKADGVPLRDTQGR